MTFLGGHTVRTDDGWVQERKRWEGVVRKYRLLRRLHLHHWLPVYGAALSVQGYLKIVKNAVFRIDEMKEWPEDLSSSRAGYTLGRRMFTTRDEYIGLGPNGMQSGDLIALFEGGKVPFVVRKKGEKYKLVGECYIHGIMSGERFEEAKCQILWLV